MAAVNAVNLRQMRNLNEYTVGAYMTFSMVLIYGPMSYILDGDFSIISSFSTSDFVLLACLGITGCLFNILRFKALQFQEPGKLGGISYF